MGVDIATYRGRIGTFVHGCGQDVYTTETVIDFSRSLKSIGTVVFIGMLLLIAGLESNPGPKNEVYGKRSLQNDGDVPSNVNYRNRHLETKFVKVKGLPHDTSVRFMKMFCRDKGKGNVHNVSIDRTKRSALIEFEEICAAQRFLDSQPIVIQGTEVEVMPHNDETSRTIKVTNIPSDVDAKHILWYFFENVEGEPISGIDIDREKDFAIVTFASAEAARRMVERKAFITDDLSLSVSVIDETDEGHFPPIESEDDTEQTLSKTDAAAQSREKDTKSESANVKSKMVSKTDSAYLLRKTVHKGESDEIAQLDSAEDDTERKLPKTDAAAETQEKDTTSESENMESKMVLETYSTDVLRQTVHKSKSGDLAQPDSAEDDTEKTLTQSHSKDESVEKDTKCESANLESTMVPETDSADVLRQGLHKSELDDISKQNSAAAPDMPTGPIKFGDIAANSLTMDWLAPKSDGGSKLSGFKIQVTTDQKISTKVTPTDKTSHKVQDLKTDQPYYFSVIAFNDVGDSKPLVSDIVICQAPTEKPNRPNEPFTCKTITKDSVELSWKLPDSDGGSPITSYAIEKRIKSYSRWTHVKQTSDDSTTITLKQLQTGSELYFRVSAVNKIGTGEPLEMSKYITIKSSYVSTQRKSFQNLLKELKLEKDYPGKIKMSSVLALNLESKTNNFTHGDLPWLLLRYIVLSHSDCRDQIMADALESMNPDMETDMAMDVFESNDKDMTSPLDILLVVIQCCDPFVQSFLYKKMHLCKLAIPFRYYQDKIVSLWPLRSVVIEHSGTEFTAAQVPTHTLAFIRMGRPSFSKSKFLNSFLSENYVDIFFNKDCPLGTTQRNISSGCIEMFWKLSKNNVFTAFNLRGDLNTNFYDRDIHFLMQMIDILSIVVELDDIKTYSKKLDGILKKFKHVILVVNNPRPGMKTQENIVRNLKKQKNVKIIVTYANGQEISPLNLKKKLQTFIVECSQNCRSRTLECRLSSDSSTETDENKIKFTKTKQQAAKVIDNINKAGQKNTKQTITPASTMYSKSLAMKRRKVYRSQMEEGEKINLEINELMDKQIKSISPTVKEFIRMLVQNKSESVEQLQLFIAWVSGFLDLQMRDILPQMAVKSKREYEALWNLKNENNNSEAIVAQEQKVKLSNDSIDDVIFSVSHLFREIAHVYEACYTTNTSFKSLKLPKKENVVDVFAELIINGYPFQLLNGEDNYMPITWIEKVIGKVHERIKKEKVFAVSILGIQSSGKSTLLNTMFGSQFAVSAGRCTMGANIQLLTVNEKRNQPFKYLLLIDTEGLRAPELGNDRFNHDNELATFVTGLGDMTILNIMGENMSEISEILQIMVHAFLRLKLANKGLDMNKRCIFVHHNVADISASEKMHQGFQKIMTTLDTMTKEAASTEGISDIVRFSQVMNFDIKTHIWFFPNLWQGNPPSARINARYSEMVCELRSHILMQAFSAQGKSYKTLEHTLVHIKDLWKGVLKEDFVFSFRNSLEIKAYCWLEKMFQDILWKHEISIMDELQKQATASFSKCDSNDQLESQHMNVKQIMSSLLEERKSSAEEMLSSLFVNNEFKEIIDTWKDKRDKQLNMSWCELRAQCECTVRRLYKKRDIELRTSTMCQEHEQKLFDMSKKLASRIKQENLDKFQKENEFESLWKNFERDLPKKTESKWSILELFELNLKEILHKDHTILRSLMDETKWRKLDNTIQSLESSVEKLKIEETDLSSTYSYEGGKAWIKGKKVQAISLDIISVFSDLDAAIQNSCSTDCEILEQHVKEFLRKIEKWVNKINAEKDRIGMTLTSKFIIKIYLYASRYAAMKFQNHNEMYEQKYGITAHLLRYKQQTKVRLDAMIADRSAEDTAALLFASVIEEFVTDTIKGSMSTEVYNQLLQEIPRPKFNLMLEMVIDLANTGKFKDWMQYLISAEGYSREWVAMKCKNHLFGSNKAYSASAKAKASVIFVEIKNAICKSLEQETEVRTTDAWIQSFIECMIKYPISSDKFNNVVVGFKEITAKNVAEFSSLLLDEIEQSQRRIDVEIQQTTDKNVVWGDENPYEKTFHLVWGCTETCPFCGETCARNKSHEGIPHHCIQHRPLGCLGVHQSTSKEISLPSCSYKVQSTSTHTCGVFGFNCNDKLYRECSLKIHNYKDFKTFAPEWDIEPSPNMDDTSKIWMWFMGHFKEDLKKHFDIVVDNIPERWDLISKADAIKSYGELMSDN